MRLIATISMAVILGVGLTQGANSQTFPTQDIKFVTGFPPGSGADIITRFVAEKFRTKANRTVIVENKVGAAGNVAVEMVARAKPDGYTMLLLTGSSVAASMHLFKSPPVDVPKALRIAATISKQAFMMVVDSSSPYKTVQELTDAMKKKGASASYAVAAPSGIVMGELYKALSGVEAVEVRFRTGADSLNELATGKIDYAMLDPQVALAQSAQGKLRILAHSAGTRFKFRPDIPTMAENGIKGMDLTGWWAIIVPAGTPDPIVAQVNAWMNEILREPEVREFLARTGGDAFISSVEDGQKLFISEGKAWEEYLRIAKIEKQ
ncbi:tripartite tricarboxylate transporter substrate binding protein [Roseiarcaceae bacterium H3SJ34-1]|uniref:Bug family tripartite tricarboxylate transporter substrate binding protein n=1 Tax=Terripilifer ovatus TaxID=3032367 RepID=UPI003AB9A0E7|nr:tripartite tricarboxylate transporter substrate binding protein [Roseiarcaceae bacterium H3SJ34-1]